MKATSPAQLRVLFLGPLRDQVECAQAEVAWPSDGSQDAFWKALCEKYPGLNMMTSRPRLARHDEFMDASAPLSPGDEIALIPPVSGG